MLRQVKSDPCFWTRTKCAALTLVWRGELIEAEIAQQLGIGRRTLSRWKAHPDFQAALCALAAEWRERLQEPGNGPGEGRPIRSRARFPYPPPVVPKSPPSPFGVEAWSSVGETAVTGGGSAETPRPPVPRATGFWQDDFRRDEE